MSLLAFRCAGVSVRELPDGTFMFKGDRATSFWHHEEELDDVLWALFKMLAHGCGQSISESDDAYVKDSIKRQEASDLDHIYGSRFHGEG
jgi:hypothetical protein